MCYCVRISTHIYAYTNDRLFFFLKVTTSKLATIMSHFNTLAFTEPIIKGNTHDIPPKIKYLGGIVVWGRIIVLAYALTIVIFIGSYGEHTFDGRKINRGQNFDSAEKESDDEDKLEKLRQHSVFIHVLYYRTGVFIELFR